MSKNVLGKILMLYIRVRSFSYTKDVSFKKNTAIRNNR